MTTPTVVYDIANGSPGWAEFYTHRGETDIVMESAHWPTEVTEYAGDGELLFRNREHGDQILFRLAGCIAYVRLAQGEAGVTVTGPTLGDVAACLAALRREIPPMPFDEEGRRPVTFWTWGNYGPDSTTRRIEVPTWESVETNYPASVSADLGELMSESFRPAFGGQLVLWQGEPGTGKTWALRALVWEWRSWADFHYIVDPDRFFGEQASYLTTVLFHEEACHPGDTGCRHGERWKVLLLEDSGELLSADAKERTGQALSRLLNVVDGLIGQGLRVLVLVTTNEPIKRLHEAVARPGRCAARIEFAPLTDDELEHWLGDHGCTTAGRIERATLAELYALAAGQNTRSRGPLGFAAKAPS